MIKYIFLLVLLISSKVKGQEVESFKQIDSIVHRLDSIASQGLSDTLKSKILTNTGQSSVIFLLNQKLGVVKIYVSDKLKSYEETYFLISNKPIFAEISQQGSSYMRVYIMGNNSFLKDGEQYNKGSSVYWLDLIDNYLGLIKD